MKNMVSTTPAFTKRAHHIDINMLSAKNKNFKSILIGMTFRRGLTALVLALSTQTQIYNTIYKFIVERGPRAPAASTNNHPFKKKRQNDF